VCSSDLAPKGRNNLPKLEKGHTDERNDDVIDYVTLTTYVINYKYVNIIICI